MQFLVRKTGGGKAHICADDDTACRMWSTGGLNQKYFEVSDQSDGLDVCMMCQSCSATADDSVEAEARLPDGWRDDAGFMLDYANLGEWETDFIKNMIRKKRALPRDCNRFAGMAFGFFLKAEDYIPFLEISGGL